jgi:hypothetical protein
VFRPVPDAASVTIQERLSAEADDLVFLEDQAHERAFKNRPMSLRDIRDMWDEYWAEENW